MQTRSRLAAVNNSNAPVGAAVKKVSEENKGVSKVLANKNASMSKGKPVLKKEVLPSKKRSALGDVSNVQQNQVSFRRWRVLSFNGLDYCQ